MKTEPEVIEYYGYKIRVRRVSIWDETYSIFVSCSTDEDKLIDENANFRNAEAIEIDNQIGVYVSDEDFENLSDEELEMKVNNVNYSADTELINQKYRIVPMVLAFEEDEVDKELVLTTDNEQYLFSMAQVMKDNFTAKIYTLDTFVKEMNNENSDLREKIDGYVFRTIMLNEIQSIDYGN